MSGYFCSIPYVDGDNSKSTMRISSPTSKRSPIGSGQEKELVTLRSHYLQTNMATRPSVFISYNPHSEFEQTLAIRLHTIGAVHGLNMLMPDRSYNSLAVSLETRNRIMLSDFFILFSTGMMSSTVQQEISLAFSKLRDRSKILVVYDKSLGKNLYGADNCTEVYIDVRDHPLKIVTEISNKIKSFESKGNGDSFLSSLGGILLVGLGLFTLHEVFNDEPKPRKRKPAKKTAKKKRKS
jgi:hypothetical protein